MQRNSIIRFCFGRSLFWIGLVLVLFCSNLAASTETGRVGGWALDPGGAPVAGAHVKLVNAAGALIQGTASDEHGEFILQGIDPGEYQLMGESPSFVSVVSDVWVASGQQRQVNLQFQQLV